MKSVRFLFFLHPTFFYSGYNDLNPFVHRPLPGRLATLPGCETASSVSPLLVEPPPQIANSGMRKIFSPTQRPPPPLSLSKPPPDPVDRIFSSSFHFHQVVLGVFLWCVCGVVFFSFFVFVGVGGLSNPDLPCLPLNNSCLAPTLGTSACPPPAKGYYRIVRSV